MSTTQKKKPSLYARKLLEKLRTLHPNASLESRQAIANWIIFNRKKAEAMGEGMVLAVAEETGGGAVALPNATTTTTTLSQRLMLFLRVLHQVFIEGSEDTDSFEKSSQLRSILADVALIPLFEALAKSCSDANNNNNNSSSNSSEYMAEVKEMIDSWKESNVFDGPTVWEGYKKAWGRAVQDANKGVDNAAAAAAAAVGGGESDVKAAMPTVESADTTGGDDVLMEDGAQIIQPSKESVEESKKEEENNDAKEQDSNMSKASITEPIPTPTTEEVTETKDPEHENSPSKRDSMTSVASIDIDFDAEGVEEAEVEPAKFLEASKVIASLQIARDLGSDAAMNLSSALGSVPEEVEQACSTVYAQQQESGEDAASSIEELLSAEQLSNLPDEVLDIDLDYARKSLQTYREAILQQRKARLQCLQLLLQSRCSFGSLDAARAFGCEDGSDKGLNIILEKLKKVKDKLIDAMALEGLDVEEDDADEKKMKEEEEQLKPLDWFPGQKKEPEEEPSSKKQKVV